MATDAKLVINSPTDKFTFQGYEIPEWVTFDGPANLVIHKQPGGTRQIDSMGPDPDPIRWDGIMLTHDSDLRANRLDAIYRAGNKCTVSYGLWTVDVVISHLIIKYKASNYCEYSIELTEVVNAAAGDANVGAFTTDLNTLQNNAQQLATAFA